MLTIPGSYYYKTRYAKPALSLAHIIKTWILPSCILWIACNNATPQIAFTVIVSIFGFQAIYDYFCYKNDHSSTLHESKPTLRNYKLANLAGIKTGLVFYPAAAVLLIATLDTRTAIFITLIYSSLAIIFFGHNLLSDKTPFKLITFYALYITKYALLAASFSASPLDTHPTLVLLLLFPLMHLPAYAAKKIESFKSLSKMPSPTILKTCTLLLLSTSNILYTLIAFIFMLTAFVEFLLGRRNLIE